MRRLLLSVGLALLVGGVAVAVKADQPFGGRARDSRASNERAPADRPRAISDLPLVDQPTPGQPTADGAAADPTETPPEAVCRREELLVKFEPGADPATVAAHHGASIASSIPQIGVYVLAVPPGTGAATLSALSADPDVEYAEPNGVVRVPELPPTADPCAYETPLPEPPTDDGARR